MRRKFQFAGWLIVLAMSVAATASSYAQKPGPNAAQNRSGNKAPNPPKQQGNQQRQQPRQAQNQARAERRQNGNANRPPDVNPNHSGRETRPNNNPNRPPSAYTPPPRRFNELSLQDKQKVLENHRRLQNLPPAQRQEMQDRARIWGQLTPQQQNHIRNDVMPKWRQMPPERRQAIQQRLRVLQNMPESARNQRLNDPNFTRGMSEEDKATLHDLSHLHVGGAPELPNE
jgi:Protein of unknown function (DUF3106)